MATTKAILMTKKKKKDGTIPIYVRICEGNRVKFISTGYAIPETDWDAEARLVKKTNAKAALINAVIRKKETLVDQKSLMVLAEDTGSSVIQELNKSEKKSDLGDFFKIADVFYKEQEKMEKFSRVSSDMPRVNHVKAFTGKSNLKFEEIDAAFLRRFRLFLKTKYKCSERTIVNHLVVIRTLFNRAIQEKLVKPEHYPFGKGGIQIKYPETIKTGLNEAEVRKIEEADFSQRPHLDHARNVWLFSFYLAGIRIADVFRMKWKDIIDERLIYTMGKNAKVVSLKIPEKALSILDKYRESENQPDDCIFPELKYVDHKNSKQVYQKITRANHKINTHLKTIGEELEIKKKLTCHISRHTFGNITGDKISPQMLQKLYRHTDIKTSMGYQANFIHNDVDDALESVINF
jgi:integrase/recombinase XerD